MERKELLAQDRERIESYLRGVFTAGRPGHDLFEAMNYSLLAGGKRIRPILAIETCRFCGGDTALALPLGCAVEMVHTYSLIHDDLPAMDDDDLRRGKPTSHKVFGEATAILAGDGLLTAAFALLAQAPGLSPEQRLRAIEALSRAAGPDGMVGGQALDMAGEGTALDRTAVERLQSLKTGALIRVAAHMGVIAAEGGDALAQAVDAYARQLGLAFQVRDDLLDVESTADQLGKSVGSDAQNGKTTFVTLLGPAGCRELVEQLSREAQAALAPFPRAEILQEFAADLAKRTF